MRTSQVLQGYLWEWGWEWRHDGEVLNTSNCWPCLCTNWTALSTGKITIQSIRGTNNYCVIHWIEIYPVDIGLSNLWSFEARYVNPGCLDKNFAPCVSLFTQGDMHTRRKKNLQYSSLPFSTLGARDWLRPTAEDVSAFGQHRKFPPHARKTSGTQGSHAEKRQKRFQHFKPQNPHTNSPDLSLYIFLKN